MIKEIFTNFADNKWRTKKELIAHAKDMGIKISERELRRKIERFNRNYQITELYVVHGNKGYKLTTDKNEIRSSIKDLKTRAVNMFSKYHDTRKILGERDTVTLLDDGRKIDTYELIKAIKES